MLSLVLADSSLAELFSRRDAAASRSGQSVRLTNSNRGSETASGLEEEPALRVMEDSSPGRSETAVSSEEGEMVSLKSCRESATLRPLPADAIVSCPISTGEEEEDDVEPSDDRGDRGRAVFEGDMVDSGRAADVDGKVKFLAGFVRVECRRADLRGRECSVM